jgi:WD40 repeat protein
MVKVYSLYLKKDIYTVLVNDVTSLIFYPKGHYLITGSAKGMVGIWSPAPGALAKLLIEKDIGAYVSGIGVSDNGSMLAVLVGKTPSHINVYKIIIVNDTTSLNDLFKAWYEGELKKRNIPF